MESGNLAIIPARGGSKRITGKNIKEFLGEPIISYVIRNAYDSGLFEEVMVSTDSERIAEVARKYGAKVPFFRSDRNSTDTATTSDVISEVLAMYREKDKSYKSVCCIYPSAVFSSPDILKESFRVLKEKKAETVFALVEYAHPVWRAFRIDDGKASMIWPENRNERTQDIEKVYHDGGQFYWINTESFLMTGNLINENSNAIVMRQDRVHDIDSEEDWKIAEIKYRLINGQ